MFLATPPEVLVTVASVVVAKRSSSVAWKSSSTKAAPMQITGLEDIRQK
jgi:hypothetical protein